MKRICILLFAIAIGAISVANDTIALDGKEWVVHTKGIYPEALAVTYRMRIEGDTVVNGRTCKKLHSHALDENRQEKYSIGYCYQEGSRFYVGNRLMFDFGLQIGDQFQINDFTNYIVTDIGDTILADGIPRKYLKLNPYEESQILTNVSDYWVEGVGAITLGIYGNDFYSAGMSIELRQCMYNDVIIYNTYDISSFVNESKQWHCQRWGQSFTTLEDRYYYFQGDTIIDGILAKKMYQKFSKESNNENYQASLYEDGKKVYCCYPNQKDFNLIYDFGAKEGEKLVIDGMSYKVDGVKEILVNNQSLRVLYLSYTEGDEKYQFTWTQGFGGESDPLSSGPKLPGSYENFISCEMDGKVVITSEEIPAYTPTCSWVGAVWSYYSYQDEDYSYFRYTVLDRPEEIDGLIYYPLVKYKNCEYQEGDEVEAIYRIRQKGDKVYIMKEDFVRYKDFVRFKEEGNDYILYDFSLNKDDEYCWILSITSGIINDTISIREIDTFRTYNGQNLKRLAIRRKNIEIKYYLDLWVEGIGSTYDLLEPFGHSKVDCSCYRTLNYFCSADSSVIYRNPRSKEANEPPKYGYYFDSSYYDHFKEDDCALNPSQIGEVTDVSPFIIQTIGSNISCTSSTATKLEIYTMDAEKVGEAAFANGEAVVKVSKIPATYLYIVTYPNGRRESGKVAIGH